MRKEDDAEASQCQGVRVWQWNGWRAVETTRRFIAGMTIHIGELTSLRRALQNRLSLPFDFGSLSLVYLLFLLGITQTSDAKRGTRLCHKI